MNAVEAVLSSSPHIGEQLPQRAVSDGFVNLAGATGGAQTVQPSGYASLMSKPVKVAAAQADLGVDIKATMAAFQTGISQGVVKPHMQKMMDAMEGMRRGDPLSSGELMTASLQVSYATSVSHTMTTLSTSVRKGLTSLVEKVQ